MGAACLKVRPTCTWFCGAPLLGWALLLAVCLLAIINTTCCLPLVAAHNPPDSREPDGCLPIQIRLPVRRYQRRRPNNQAGLIGLFGRRKVSPGSGAGGELKKDAARHLQAPIGAGAKATAKVNLVGL